MVSKVIFGCLALALVLQSGFLFLVAKNTNDAHAYAIVGMAWGLILIWVCCGGFLMYRFRDRVRAFVHTTALPWQLVFVGFATLLALVEEAITVTLTNLAPLFGAARGVVGITASTNYIDVIFFHSVIVFIPLFIGWAVILSKYAFKPFSVFVLFGIMGVIAEMSLVGPQVALIGSAQWIFVYGLMVYLPAYCIPENRNAKPAGFIHHILAIPAAFVIALPLLIPIVFVIANVFNHPSLHF